MKKQNKFFQSSIIWSNKKSFVNKIVDCNDEFVLNIISEKVKSIVGKIIKINSKQAFPLSAHINDTFFNKRVVYLGDAAHSVHPIAGQGWNLGIKDVKNLELVCKKYLLNKEEIGTNFFCEEYNSLAYKNALQLYQITDKLNFHFKINSKFYRKISNVGFSLIEKNKNIKDKITKFAMGF